MPKPTSPKFPDTSLNNGKRNIQSKLTHDSYTLSIGLWSYPNKHNRIYDSIQLHRKFGYSFSNGEPWGSSFQGPGFPVGMSFP